MSSSNGDGKPPYHGFDTGSDALNGELRKLQTVILGGATVNKLFEQARAVLRAAELEDGGRERLPS